MDFTRLVTVETWDPDFLARSPMFEPLRVHAAAFPASWPELADLQRLLGQRSPPVLTVSGVPLIVVAQGRKAASLEDRYEARIHLKGALQMRSRNWHDLLNLLVWLAFPRAKAALNARHYAALAHRRAGENRGPVQDALTLFDEGGVIVASSDGELLTLLRGFRWKELFWDNRERVRERMRFYLFGHALYEKALAPFLGVTGRGILLEVEPELLRAPLAEQLDPLDARVAAHIAAPRSLSATRELAPVPILGVPGWCAETERKDFYDDAEYFRPGRRTKGGRQKEEG